MRRVIIESPYAGDVERNLRYLRACMRDSVLRGETPYASHGLLTQDGVLDGDVPKELEAGTRAGFAWREVADATIVYTDLGTSTGMRAGIEHAMEMGLPVEYRSLGGWWTVAQDVRDATGEKPYVRGADVSGRMEVSDAEVAEFRKQCSALGVAEPSDKFIRTAILARRMRT